MITQLSIKNGDDANQRTVNVSVVRAAHLVNIPEILPTNYAPDLTTKVGFAGLSRVMTKFKVFDATVLWADYGHLAAL